jgi:two-component system, cell cycle response regulator
VSIIEDISELEGRFEALINEARQNEKTLKKFQSFEIILINSDSPSEFFNTLLEKSREDFDWDEVTITLVDKDFGIRRLLTHSGDLLEENSDIIFLDETASLHTLYNGEAGPILGHFDPEAHDLLFPGNIEAPASVALLPLQHKRELVGSFNIGSMDEERFNDSVGTDFLEHLAVIITVCIDNLLSREHLKYLGLIDNLTGVNNRRFFEQRLKEETARVRRSQSPISCLFVDIDHFKRINDTYGHPVGDQVLRHVAHIIREQVRTIDIVARYGGEEFTVILLQSAEAKAMEIAERIRDRIERQPYLKDNGEAIALTASIGVNTLLPVDCTDDLPGSARKFVERADQALYTAKNSGRNKIACYFGEKNRLAPE